MVMAQDQITRHGFTLVEIIVGLAVAGMLAAIVASVMGRGIVASQGLLAQEEMDRQKVTLRTILHRDIKGITVQSGLAPAPEGFTLQTGHNTLVSSSLPVEVSWSFSGNKIVRTEQNKELDYYREQVLTAGLESFSMDLFCPVHALWLDLDRWLMGQDRPHPLALRLNIGLSSAAFFEIVEHLPVHEY